MTNSSSSLTSLKEVVVELDFVSDSLSSGSIRRSGRTKMLHIPVVSPYHDFANLDSALWTLSQKDPDLKRILREQELIYFNSILSFTFLAFDAGKQAWNPVDPTSAIKIPEKTYLKVQLDHRPKNQTPPSLPLPVDMNPCRLIAKKLEGCQSSSSRHDVTASQDPPVSADTPTPSVPVKIDPPHTTDTSEQDRQSAFEKLFFIDDDEEAEKQLSLAAEAHQERIQLGSSQNHADSDSDEDDRLMIDEDREEVEETSTSVQPSKTADVMDLDNDDVDLDEWKQMLGIGDDKPDTEKSSSSSTNSNRASGSSPGLPRFPSEPVQVRPVAEVIPFQREPDVPVVIIDSKSESDTSDPLVASQVTNVSEITTELKGPAKTAPVDDLDVSKVDKEKSQREIEVIDLEDGEILSENEEHGQDMEPEGSKAKEETKLDSPESPVPPRKRSKKKKSRRRRDDTDSDASSDSGSTRRLTNRKHSKRKSRRRSRDRDRSRSPQPYLADCPSEPDLTQQNNLPHPKPCVPPTAFQPGFYGPNSEPNFGGPYFGGPNPDGPNFDPNFVGPCFGGPNFDGPNFNRPNFGGPSFDGPNFGGPNFGPIGNQFRPPRPWAAGFGPHGRHPHPRLRFHDSGGPFNGCQPRASRPFGPSNLFPQVRSPHPGMSLPRPYGMRPTPHIRPAFMNDPAMVTPSGSYQYQAEKYHKKSKAVASSGKKNQQDEAITPNQSHPTEGDIYASTLGLNFKNPVQGLHEYCTKKGWKMPIFSVKETCKVDGLAQWKMKVMVNGQTYFADKFYDSKKNTKKAAAKAALRACGIKLR
ncbi:uncharacterized protein LOC131889266 isoform X2 [Tigriopus californicus]|uniref:uncharacterized protein LOC131889266 isoform X2 n=1 Tax=Tigriopus californicus TaxID=6832 RepID=UPI0027DA90C7|nr:uncharacterized protein LOC131889266 isoform X2 [Tigriopus californicus]